MNIKNLFFQIKSCFIANKQRRRAYRYAFCGEYETSSFSRCRDIRSLSDKHFLSYDYTIIPPASGNLGDNIQTKAVEIALKNIFGEGVDFQKFPRDRLSCYSGDPRLCIMQGWYEHHSLGFLPSKDVIPVWIGTHFEQRTRERLEYLCSYIPKIFSDTEIGCRDISTLQFCRNHGISAYLSRCLTLTLPKRDANPEKTKVFCVNVGSWVLDFLPKELRDHSEVINQRCVKLGYKKSDLRNYEIAAQKLLERYKNEATLVITSALHCAQPCLALGIPVVFVNPGQEKCERFSSFKGIIPIYERKDFEMGNVDFFPASPDFESLKKDMLENLKLSVKKALGHPCDESRILVLRKRIEEFSVKNRS